MSARPSELNPVRLARGCWTDEVSAALLPGRCASALECTDVYTVVASVTAARLHGFWLPPGSDTIHLATATPDRRGRDMTRTRRPEFVGHRFELRPQDVVLVGGIPVTSVARTWRDLARVLPLPDLVAAGDSALRLGHTTTDLAEHLTDTRRQPGLGLARTALPLLDSRSASRPESHLRFAVSVPFLPRFEVNEDVYRSEGGWLARPDLSLRRARLALEYQGAEHADPARMRRDITRANDMRDDDWTMFEFGPVQVFQRRAQIAQEVYSFLRERAPELLPRRPAARRSGASRRGRPARMVS